MRDNDDYYEYLREQREASRTALTLLDTIFLTLALTAGVYAFFTEGSGVLRSSYTPYGIATFVVFCMLVSTNLISGIVFKWRDFSGGVFEARKGGRLLLLQTLSAYAQALVFFVMGIALAMIATHVAPFFVAYVGYTLIWVAYDALRLFIGRLPFQDKAYWGQIRRSRVLDLLESVLATSSMVLILTYPGIPQRAWLALGLMALFTLIDTVRTFRGGLYDHAQ